MLTSATFDSCRKKFAFRVLSCSAELGETKSAAAAATIGAAAAATLTVNTEEGGC